MLRTLGTVALLAACAPVGRADVLYTTGFEPPAYTLGPLAGQNGWVDRFGTGGGVVTNALTGAATQVLQIDGARVFAFPGSGFLLSRYLLSFDVDAAAQGLVIRTQADIRLDGPSTATDGDPVADDVVSANLSVWNGVDSYLASWIVSASGYAFGFGSNDEPYLFQTPVPIGQYNTFGLEFDYVAFETRFLLNGSLAFALPFDPDYSRTRFGDVELELASVLDPAATAQYQARFGRLSVTARAVPEPVGVALVGLGVAGLMAGRRGRGGAMTSEPPPTPLSPVPRVVRPRAVPGAHIPRRAGGFGRGSLARAAESPGPSAPRGWARAGGHTWTGGGPSLTRLAADPRGFAHAAERPSSPAVE